MSVFQQIYLGPNVVPDASLKIALGTWKAKGPKPLPKEFLVMSMMLLSTTFLGKSPFPSLLCNIKISESQIAGLHYAFYYLTRLMPVIKFSLKHES